MYFVSDYSAFVGLTITYACGMFFISVQKLVQQYPSKEKGMADVEEVIHSMHFA
jgi:hypothetical protein